MAEVSANFRRVISIAPYETLTIEIGATEQVQEAEGPKEAAIAAGNLYKSLEKVGNKLVENAKLA